MFRSFSLKMGLFLCLTPYLAAAEIVDLLEVPLSDGTKHTYSVDLKEKCSFEGVDKIITPAFNEAKKDNIVSDTLNNIQKAANLEIEDQKIESNLISFHLQGSKNVSFEFSFVGCKLFKEIVFNKKRYAMDTLEVVYEDALGSPVVQKIIVKDEGKNEVETLYPAQLKGQIAAYEFIAGPVVNIRTNVRLNNQKTFERTHPVVKPIPGFLFRYGPLFVNRDGFGTLVFHKYDVTLLALGVIEGEPYQMGGIDERKEGIFIGGALNYEFIQLTYFKDFVKNKGYNVKLNLAPSFHRNIKWKFTPQAYAQYWDDQYVDYYFGVSPTESRATGLRTYKGQNTINYGTLFEVNHFVDRWTYIGAIGAKFYGKNVHSSPTVVKKNETRIILGVLYKIL